MRQTATHEYSGLIGIARPHAYAGIEARTEICLFFDLFSGGTAIQSNTRVTAVMRLNRRIAVPLGGQQLRSQYFDARRLECRIPRVHAHRRGQARLLRGSRWAARPPARTAGGGMSLMNRRNIS